MMCLGLGIFLDLGYKMESLVWLCWPVLMLLFRLLRSDGYLGWVEVTALFYSQLLIF